MRAHLLAFCALALAAGGCSSSTTNSSTRKGAGNGAGNAAEVGTGGSTSLGQGSTDPTTTVPTGTGGTDTCPDGQVCDNSTADNTGCGYQDISANVVTIEKPTNLLFIYDRSGSMEDAWGTSTKWQSASNAVVQALTPIQHLIVKVGSVFFPGSPDPLICNNDAPTCNQSDPLDSNPVAGCCNASSIGAECYVPAISAADQIPFTDPASFLSQVVTKCMPPGQGGARTPWEGAAVKADDAIYDALAAGTLFIPLMTTSTNPTPDAGTPTGDLPTDAAMPMQDGANELVIIFVTDGAPNCDSNVPNVLAFAAKWLNDGMKTYVLGLPGAAGSGGGGGGGAIGGSANPVDNLNNLAVSGGTTMYIDAADPMTLQQTLTDIVLENAGGGLASCDIQLGQAALAPDMLRLIVTMKDGTEAVMPRTDNSGAVLWSLAPDNMMVTLYGNLCDQAKAGSYPNLRFDFGCEDIPPAPPPEPVVLQ